MSTDINAVKARINEATKAARTLNRYSDALEAHVAEFKGKPAAGMRALAVAFKSATVANKKDGTVRAVSFGDIAQLAKQSIEKLPNMRTDEAIDAGLAQKVRTTSAVIRHGGTIANVEAMKKLEASATRFLAIFATYKDDARKSAQGITLDVVEVAPEVVTA